MTTLFRSLMWTLTVRSHYTVDTVKILKQEYPDQVLIYLLGGILYDLPNWYEVDALLENLDGVGVMRRPGDDIDLSKLYSALPQLEEKLNFVTAPLLKSQQTRFAGESDRTVTFDITCSENL